MVKTNQQVTDRDPKPGTNIAFLADRPEDISRLTREVNKLKIFPTYTEEEIREAFKYPNGMVLGYDSYNLKIGTRATRLIRRLLPTQSH